MPFSASVNILLFIFSKTLFPRMKYGLTKNTNTNNLVLEY